MKKELHQVVDWSRVDKEDYLLAMERSPVRDTEIKHILKAALTNETDSRDVFIKELISAITMKGILLLKQKN